MVVAQRRPTWKAARRCATRRAVNEQESWRGQGGWGNRNDLGAVQKQPEMVRLLTQARCETPKCTFRTVTEWDRQGIGGAAPP